MNTSNLKEVLFTGEPTKIEQLAESYADTVHPSCRRSSKRAYMDGYLEAIENEGLYEDEVVKKLSSSYSNFKVAHMFLKGKYNFLVEELRVAKAALIPTVIIEEKPMFKQLEIEF